MPHMSKTPAEGFSGYLRRRMRQAGIGTASELAHLSGVNQSLISRWLRDDAQPGVRQLRRIAPYLGVPVLELMVAAGHIEEDEAGMTEPSPSATEEPDAPSVTQVRHGNQVTSIPEDVWGQMTDDQRRALLELAYGLVQEHRHKGVNGE